MKPLLSLDTFHRRIIFSAATLSLLYHLLLLLLPLELVCHFAINTAELRPSPRHPGTPSNDWKLTTSHPFEVSSKKFALCTQLPLSLPLPSNNGSFIAPTVKLDPTDIRYVSADAYRVLSAVEQGSKNHELVPLGLIAQISGARSGGVNKALGELAKRKLVGRIQNAKYEGYRLTYGGYDFLAARTFGKRDTIYSIGNQIGTGKESDIYVVADTEGEQMVMKIHRLGRVSFRAIKSKRDYLRKGQSASWMYMSRLAAIKEFAFMKVSSGFLPLSVSFLVLWRLRRTKN